MKQEQDAVETRMNEREFWGINTMTVGMETLEEPLLPAGRHSLSSLLCASKRKKV